MNSKKKREEVVLLSHLNWEIFSHMAKFGSKSHATSHMLWFEWPDSAVCENLNSTKIVYEMQVKSKYNGFVFS